MWCVGCVLGEVILVVCTAWVLKCVSSLMVYFSVTNVSLCRGTGHFSVLVGSIKTVESLGAPFSHLLGEMLVDSADYPTAYGVLSIAALLPLWTYWRFMPSGYRNAEGIMIEDLSVKSVESDSNGDQSGDKCAKAGVISRDSCDISESGSVMSMDNSSSNFIKKA